MKIVQILTISIFLPVFSSGAPPKAKLEIKANEIGGNYVLVGESGLQLGTVFKAAGKLHIWHPGVGVEMEISEINGKKLNVPIRVRIKDTDLTKKMPLDKLLVIMGRELGELKPIELLNQIDRSNVGNMGCTVQLSIDKVIDE